MKFSLIILFTVFFICLSHGSSNNPNIISFDRSDYNAGNKNWSISEDDKGILYVGNDLGLLEFDGIKWSLYKTPKKDVVRAVYAMSNDLIFTGGYEEFGFWRRDISGKLQYQTLSSELPAGSLHNDDIWRICEKDNSIYFQSFNGVFVYDHKKTDQYPINKNVLLLNKVYNELWIQEIGGALFKLGNDNLIKIPESDVFSKTEVKSILPTKDNKFLIATSSMGIYIYDGKSFLPWNTSDGIKTSNINCGILSKSGNYFFGTLQGGIYELSPLGEIINHFNTNNYFKNNTVLSLYEDRSNNIWVGFDRGLSCIAYIDGVSCVTDPLGQIGSVYTATIYNNKLFIGTNQGVYYINESDLGSLDAIHKFKFLPNTEGQVWCLSVIGSDLYCANNQGVYIIDQNLSIAYRYPIYTGVFTIKKITHNTLLFGTYTGLIAVDVNTRKLIITENLMEPINRVEDDHAGNIWLQHANKGVYRGRMIDSLMKVQTLEHFGRDANDTIPYDFKLFKIGGRIAFLGDDKFYTYDDITGRIVFESTLNKTFDGISNLKSVVNITPHNFWIIGDGLIYNVSYEGQTANILSIINIDYENFSLVDNYENIVPLNDKVSLLCLDKGFLLCSNLLTEKTINTSKPYIRSIKISNSKNQEIDLELEKYMDISNSYNTISFQFATYGYFNNHVTLQYKLIGLSDEWRNIDKKENSISFERLAKGKYTFVIRTVDKFGQFSPEAIYEFEISPVWYQSSWAFLLYFVIAVILFILISKYRLYIYKKKERKKRRILESHRLYSLNEQLKQEVEEKNAELVTQTSSIIQRNETIAKIQKDLEELFKIQNNKSLQPLYKKIISTLNNDFDAEEDWKMFLIKFEQKHTIFFKNLKKEYQILTPNDLKLCACLKLNLDSKEIASLMNISVRAVENSRSRLRKKMNVPQEMNLNEFLMNF